MHYKPCSQSTFVLEMEQNGRLVFACHCAIVVHLAFVFVSDNNAAYMKHLQVSVSSQVSPNASVFNSAEYTEVQN